MKSFAIHGNLLTNTIMNLFFSNNILHCLFQVQNTSKPYQETPYKTGQKSHAPPISKCPNTIDTTRMNPRDVLYSNEVIKFIANRSISYKVLVDIVFPLEPKWVSIF